MTVGETSADKAAAAKPAPRASSRKWDNETRVGLVRRARRMNRTLAQAFPHVYCELDFTNPLELTVATILSAQSTDKRVNLTTPASVCDSSGGRGGPGRRGFRCPTSAMRRDEPAWRLPAFRLKSHPRSRMTAY